MKWYIVIALLLCVLPVASAELGVSISLNESGVVTNYLNTYWVVDVSGNGTITNPSDNDLYDLRFNVNSLGLNVVDLGGQGSVDQHSISFDTIPANGQQNFSYRLIGITAQDPTLPNRGVMYSALRSQNPKIYTTIFGRLQKSEVEDNRDARLISVTFENPSDIEYTIEQLRVIKTPQLDPNNQLNEWVIVSPDEPLILSEEGFFVEDFVDYDAAEGEVYWLQSDLYISSIILNGVNNITRLTEQNLSVPLEDLDAQLENVSENITLPSSSQPRYQLQKRVSSNLVLPNQPITVTLRLYNFESALEEYELSDSLPAGFVSNRELSWQGVVSARDAVELTYQATLEGSVPAGIDQFPAAIGVVGNVSVSSQPVAFVRRFSPENRIYIQKGVERVDEDMSRVTISVRNLGSDPVSGLTVRESLDEDVEFSQITKQPVSKGVWRIESLEAGGQWEVSYVTRSGEWVELLPAVFGVSSDGVLRTLLLEHVVRESWSFARSNMLELIGLGLLFAVPGLLVIGRRFDVL